MQDLEPPLGIKGSLAKNTLTAKSQTSGLDKGCDLVMAGH